MKFISALSFTKDFIEINKPNNLLIVELIIKSLEKYENDITFLVCIYNILLGRDIDIGGRIGYLNIKKISD